MELALSHSSENLSAVANGTKVYLIQRVLLRHESLLQTVMRKHFVSKANLSDQIIVRIATAIEMNLENKTLVQLSNQLLKKPALTLVPVRDAGDLNQQEEVESSAECWEILQKTAEIREGIYRFVNLIGKV